VVGVGVFLLRVRHRTYKIGALGVALWCRAVLRGLGGGVEGIGTGLWSSELGYLLYLESWHEEKGRTYDIAVEV
jgi:hypothetical protein